MRNRTLNVLTLLSLLLCVVVVVVWVRTYGNGAEASFRIRMHGWSVHAERGRVSIGHCRVPDGWGQAGSATAPAPRWRWDIPSKLEPWPDFGFGWGDVGVGRAVPFLGDLPALGRMFTVTTLGHYIRMPLPFLAIAAAAVPLARLWTWRRARRRARAGRCRACDYNLTGNVSGLCPECGTPAGRPAGLQPG